MNFIPIWDETGFFSQIETVFQNCKAIEIYVYAMHEKSQQARFES